MKFEWFTYSFLNMYCIFFSIPYRNLQTRNNTRKSFWLDITKLFRSRVIIRSKKDAEVSITLMLLHLCLWNGKSSEIQGWTQKAEKNHNFKRSTISNWNQQVFPKFFKILSRSSKGLFYWPDWTIWGWKR